MGPTAMSASAGWRPVTQKKTARTLRATAMVVVIAAVWFSVMASVTVTEITVLEVTVIASSSPDQSASISSLEHLGVRRIVRVYRELEQHRVDAIRIVDQYVPDTFVPCSSLFDELLHQHGIELHPCRRPSRKSAASSGSYLSPGAPLSLVQSSTKQLIGHQDWPRSRGWAQPFTAKALVRSSRFRSVRVSVASAFRSTLANSVERQRPRQVSPNRDTRPRCWQDVADVEFGLKPTGCKPKQRPSRRAPR